MAFEDLHRPLTAAGFRGAIRWIIILCTVMLVVQFVYPPITTILGLVPERVVHDHWLWQPFTYIFLHGGIFHWLFNMFIFWMFGRELEVRWGTLFFLRYFFICSLGAALCAIALGPHSRIPVIGASGGIFGLLVAWGLVFPEAVLYLYFLIPFKAWQAVALFAVVELLAGLQGGGVTSFAHLGGMATGYLYLRSGEFFAVRTWGPIQRLRKWREGLRIRKKSAVEFHEVTDELVKEVDRILEKILKNGADSLTDKERQIMARYSKLKH